jgi:hypothetical protein
MNVAELVPPQWIRHVDTGTEFRYTKRRAGLPSIGGGMQRAINGRIRTRPGVSAHGPTLRPRRPIADPDDAAEDLSHVDLAAAQPVPAAHTHLDLARRRTTVAPMAAAQSP